MLENKINSYKMKFLRRAIMASFMIGIIFLTVFMFSEKAESAGFNTPPPPGHSLLKDYFGVNLSLLPPHDGGIYYSFNRSSFEPTKHTECSYTVLDWYGNWNYNDWKTTTIWGTEPSGGEWYDVEAMYLDNDEDNIYAVIVTSCPFYYDWSFIGGTTGVGIYEPRYSSYPIYKWIVPGDLCIDLGKNPRDEKGATETSYDYGIDIVHEQRNPKDPNTVGIWHDSTQHCIQGMRDYNVGSKVYKTTADPGGQNIGDPYLDLSGNPRYDWYTANVHEESQWQHTNFDPLSPWGTMPSPLGEATVYYYKYDFPDGHKENGADTFIIEITIPRSLFGADNPKPGDNISIQWVTGCRNEGIKIAGVSHVIKGSIGDFVWNDLNGNGCQDAGEPGINGIRVNLRYASNGSLVATTLTGPSGGFASDGEYHFYVSPGDYYVEIVKPTNWMVSPKDACNDAIDSDANPNGKTDPFTLHTGEDIDTIDIGLYMEKAKIGDFVWNDLNGNGLQDAGELGIPNVKVELYYSNHTLVETKWTDANGKYEFEVLPGDYYLKFYTPPSYFFTTQNAGNDAIDSDADSTGVTAVTTLTAGEVDYSWDCGMYMKGKIGDFVWNDLNGNGCQDAGEPGIPNVIVKLYHWGGGFIEQTMTDANGKYEFEVPPGDYYVKFTLDGYDKFTGLNKGNDYVDSDAHSDGKTDKITITSNEEELKWDAGLIKYASIGDFVWNDLNGNGLQDAGEPGMAGIEVKLYGTSGFIKSTTTDANGKYLFSNISPGQYYLVFSKPEGYFFSPKNAGNYMKDSNVDTNGRTDWMTVKSGDYNMTIDAGIVVSPETMKIFIGTIYYNNQLVHYLEVDDNEYDEHITNDTIIYLNYTNPSLLNKTYYRVWKWNYSSNDWMLLFDWITTEEGRQRGIYPINLCEIGEQYNLSCCGLYQIEYYSIDIYGNNESIKWNDVCVDCHPPNSKKEYGYPNLVEYIAGEPIHWITSDTLIYINASDGPCGSGIKEIWYQYLYPNGTFYPGPTKYDWALYNGPFNVNGEDGMYVIYYYAVDNVGHVEPIRKQKFILDNTPPLGEGTILWINPYSQDVNKDTSSSFDINITSPIPIKGIQCTLKFNPSLIKIDRVDGMFPISYNGSIDNKNGTVEGIFGAYANGNITSGTFATIHFTTNKTNIGKCPIELINVTILDEDNNIIPVTIWNGVINVIGTPSRCRYDLNNDGSIDIMDLIMVAEHFKEQGYPGWIKEDVSGKNGIPDGKIDIFDMIAIATYWGSCP